MLCAVYHLARLLRKRPLRTRNRVVLAMTCLSTLLWASGSWRRANHADLINDQAIRPRQRQNLNLQEAYLLAQIERDRLANLGWTEQDYVKVERYIGMGSAGLPRSNPEYYGRLRDLGEKWFGPGSNFTAVWKSLERYETQLSIATQEEIRRTMFTTSRSGREGLPESFVQWDKMLGDRGRDDGIGQRGDQNELDGGGKWMIETMSDQDMDEAARQYASGSTPIHTPGSEDSHGPDETGDSKLLDLWRRMDFAVLKADLIRYLVLTFEGGLYADSDTQPIAHPTRWGSLSNDLTPDLSPLLQQLETLRRKRHADGDARAPTEASGYTNHSRNARFLDIANRHTILDPGVSVVITIDSHNVGFDLEGGITDAELQEPWVGEPGIPYRRYEFCQWAMMAKRGHPIFADAALTALENVEKALARGDLDGSIPVLTGPGPFTDAVFRYLLIRYGIDPISLIRRQDSQAFTTPSMRIGDLVLYRPHSFAVLSGQPEYADIGVRENVRRPIAHGYRGSWKDQGWD